jgi:hypothetical protein
MPAKVGAQLRPPATKSVETVISSLPCRVPDPAAGADLHRRFERFQRLAAAFRLFHPTQGASPAEAFVVTAFLEK